MQKKILRHVAVLLCAGSAVLAMAGCGPAPWDAEGKPDPTSDIVETLPPPVPNDLSSGSTQRELQAGAVAATVDYWSDLSMDRWLPGAVKPISISMVTTVTPDDGQKVYLQRASMLAIPSNDTETFGPLEAQADVSAVSPGYLVLSPYSYSQTFNVGPVPEESSYVTLQFTYDFLVQTTPTSGEYAKQTATDTLRVAIAAPPKKEK